MNGGRGKSRLGFVAAVLIAPSQNINAVIRFYIDTGASRTVIADRDAQRIGIDYSSLIRAPERMLGIGGEVDAYLLPDCMLVFEFDNSAFVEYLDDIMVIRSDWRTEEERRKVKQVPSLLGLDVLENYSVSFTDDSVILER